MAEKQDKDDLLGYGNSKDWEYDFGPAHAAGEIASPHIREVLEGISKEAFQCDDKRYSPNGKGAD